MNDTDLAYEAGREDGIAEAPKAEPATLVRDLLARLPADDRRAIVAEALDLCRRCEHPWAAHTETTNDGCMYEECLCDAIRSPASPEEAK